MNFARSLLYLSFFLIAVLSALAYEAYFSGEKEVHAENKPSDIVQPLPTTSQKTISPEAANASSFRAPPACYFQTQLLPENLDVYAIDAQTWIDKVYAAGPNKNEAIKITVNINSSEPTALLLTAKQAAFWKINAGKNASLWGIYVTAEEPQRVVGLGKGVMLQEHYANLNDPCGFYWPPSLQVHKLYNFSKKIFGRPYLQLIKLENGTANINGIEVDAITAAEMPSIEPRTLSAGSTSSQAQSKEIVTANDTRPISVEKPKPEKPKPISLNEALRGNQIRPGSKADIERFKSRYLTANQKALGQPFDDFTQWMPIYIITSDFTYPENLGGANAVVFIVDSQAPYPKGDPGHSPVLDMKSGNCVSRICDMVTREE
jgi:hypothetical protein